jgi:hypothetical protein
LVIQAKVDVQLFGEKLEVREPFGFVCRIVNEEGFDVIDVIIKPLDEYLSPI